MASNPREPCVTGARGLSAPIFVFAGSRSLPTDDSHVRHALPETLSAVSFALSGPGATAEAGHLPVRGDLAHINLAGRYFVPHYAVPMPHVVNTLIWLRMASRFSADEICEVRPATVFNVLDIAGDWAWGQVGTDGFVGYLPMTALEVRRG